MHLDIHIEKGKEYATVMAERAEMKSKAFVIWGNSRQVWC